ncbi:peptide-methionine (R)-S-oxide reductase MsrB [Caviibacter abscessus]|uniref:peptide-methionine (R)-S-oxide reductase MsrB n=1 Tax=Caviibacter abscessus TaxID=1766719 RepID=UPI0008397577|nr:peptide-methionine (R)-S-oxide reductase MsrB [Caviibacter abscessus]
MAKKTIYLAGGCFWGMQGYFRRIQGILETCVGYVNGNTEITNYDLIKQTGHAEALKIVYDDEMITLGIILTHFFQVIDPTILNRQGNDVGVQYRTGIYYIKDEDLEMIERIMQYESTKHIKKIVVEVQKVKNFALAEQYHQDYLEKNKDGYCHINISKPVTPVVDSSFYTKKIENLTQLQYEVTQERATEKPFNNEYNDVFEKGIYVDITSGEPLFLSNKKFESGCGWPSFSAPINNEVIKYKTDKSYDMIRTEVVSKRSNSHLGHVFEEFKGTRYCINSASLNFIPIDKMKKLGYGYYIQFL